MTAVYVLTNLYQFKGEDGEARDIHSIWTSHAAAVKALESFADSVPGEFNGPDYYSVDLPANSEVDYDIYLIQEWDARDAY